MEHDILPKKLDGNYNVLKKFIDSLSYIKGWPLDLNCKKPAGKPLPKAKPKADIPPAQRNLATDMLNEESVAKGKPTTQPEIDSDPKASTDSTSKKDESKKEMKLSEKLEVRLKRKVDAVEEHAERLLAKIKIRDVKDAEKLMKDKNGTSMRDCQIQRRSFVHKRNHCLIRFTNNMPLRVFLPLRFGKKNRWKLTKKNSLPTVSRHGVGTRKNSTKKEFLVGVTRSLSKD